MGRYGILDTAPELAFDDVALLAAHICKAPVALVSFVDEHRQWFKSRVGMTDDQTPRDISFCTHTIRRPGELLLVSDALADPRFADSPLVAGGPRIRFYAGAPLVTPDGHALGALCVKDFVPRELDAAQQQALKALGRQVVALLELRRGARERQLMDVRLNEVQTLNRAIVDNAGCAIISTAPDGLITSFNPAAERMFGYAAGEVVGLCKPDFIQDSVELSPRAAPQSGSFSLAPGFGIAIGRDGGARPNECEWACTRKDGSRLPVLLSVTTLHNAAGERTGFLGLVIDISERKRTEDLLRAKNEDLKTFAYTVSHDLKAPLRGISGYAQEIERRHQENLGERARFCVAQIITAAKNLDQLIEDLLNYSRFVGENPRTDEVRLRELVNRILRDRSLALGEHGVQVEVRVPHLVLQTWERGLHQILSNLIDNALKYSRHAVPPRLRIHADVREGTCRIGVTDNGIGFDMKYHDRIFGLFNRLVRASEFEGTGAGLAIVAKLVDKLGGRIQALSSPGRGAAFLLELPHIDAEPSAV